MIRGLLACLFSAFPPPSFRREKGSGCGAGETTAAAGRGAGGGQELGWQMQGEGERKGNTGPSQGCPI